MRARDVEPIGPGLCERCGMDEAHWLNNDPDLPREDWQLVCVTCGKLLSR